MQAALIAMMILGCDDAATQCHFIDQTEQRWETVSACDAETQSRLEAYADRNYPVVIAICQPPTNPANLVAEAESANGASPSTPSPAPPVPPQDQTAEADASSPGLTARVLDQIRSAMPETDSVKAVVTSPLRFAGEGYSWVVQRFED
jgi:hypothetical protein